MPGAGSIAFPIVALIAWLLVVMKYRHMRRDRDNPSQRALLAVFLFLALAFTTGTPRIWSLIDSYSRYGDLATLYAQTFVICATAALLALLIFWSYPPERARPRIYLRLTLIALALATMIVLFVAVDRTHSREASQLARWYAASAGYDGYLLVYQGVFAATMLDMIILCTRYARRVKDPAVHTGLLMTAIGASFGLLYSAIRLTDLAVSRDGLSLPGLENVAALSAALGALLVMTGLTFPSWAAACTGTRTWLRHHRSYRQIEPLWQALVYAVPGIVLDTPHHRPTHDFDFRLRRRVIEIHDGVLALRPYRNSHAAAQARTCAERHSLTGVAQAAHIEAACLRAALAAKTDQRVGDGNPPDHSYAGSSLDDELLWLARLSQAFAHQHTHEGSLS
jgi:hypothetical protein